MNRLIPLVTALTVLSACTPSTPNGVTPGGGTTQNSVPSEFQLVVGRTWSYDVATTVNGSTSTNTTTYEVTAIQGDSVQIKSTVSTLGTPLDLTFTLQDGRMQSNLVPGIHTTDLGNEAIQVKAGSYTARKISQTVDGLPGSTTSWFVGPILIKSLTESSLEGVTSSTSMELTNIR